MVFSLVWWAYEVGSGAACEYTILMIGLGLCCNFRDEPITSGTTSATTLVRLKRADLKEINLPNLGESDK
jgi:hypothetical protein